MATERTVYPSFTPAPIRDRNQRRVPVIGRRGHLEFTAPTDDLKTELMNKLAFVRDRLGEESTRRVTNYDALLEMVHFFITKNEVQADGTTEGTSAGETTPIYQAADAEKTEETMYLTVSSSLNNLLGRVEEHSRICRGALRCKKTDTFGHAGRIYLQCDCNSNHSSSWNSSPYLPNGRLLVNYRYAFFFDSEVN